MDGELAVADPTVSFEHGQDRPVHLVHEADHCAAELATTIVRAERIDAPYAEVIDATDRIVLPGFVDNHRHTWQTAFGGVGADWTFAEWAVAMHGTVKPHYQPEDVYAGTLIGRLEALHSGVTAMLDWYDVAQSHEHEDAAVAALRDAPGRSILCLGAGWGAADPVDAEIRRVRAQLAGDGLVTMALGLRGPESTSMSTVARELVLAAARRGSSLSISPDVELKMGFGSPMTGRAMAAGLRPTLSVDNVPSVGGDLFSTMRTAFAVQRGLDGGPRPARVRHRRRRAVVWAWRPDRQHHARQGRRPHPPAGRRPDGLPGLRPGRQHRQRRSSRPRGHRPRRRPRGQTRRRTGSTWTCRP